MTAESAIAALTDRALADGLVDVAYAELDSPLGMLTLAATGRGLARIGFAGEQDAVLEDLARTVSPRVLHAPARLDGARRQLDEYFAGTRTAFDLALDRRSTGFTLAAQEAISAIPYGMLATYLEIARAAGNANATRAAGTACRTNPIPIVVPCHRVVRTGGGIGGYAGGLAAKHVLLALEGVELV